MKKLFFLVVLFTPLFALAQTGAKWTQYCDTSGLEHNGSHIGIDQYGNTYATGKRMVNSFEDNIITFKYDSSGNHLWSHIYKTPAGNTNTPTKTLVDAAGNCYVAGVIKYGLDFCLIYKLSPAGVLLWEDTITSQMWSGGGYGNYIYDMTFTSNGDLAVAGQIPSNTVAGYPYCYVACYSPSGAMLWENLTAVNYAYNSIHSIVAGANGDVYGAGYDYYGNPPGETLVVRKYSGGGNLAWQQLYDADPTYGDNEHAYKIAIDAARFLYVGGTTESNSSQRDYLLQKYDTMGNLIWTTTYSFVTGSGVESYGDMYVTPTGDAYITGSTINSNGQREWLTVKFNSSGAQVWAKTFTLDPNMDAGAATISGEDITGDIVVGGYARKSSGHYGHVVIKYNSNGDELWKRVFNNSTGGAGTEGYISDVFMNVNGDVYVTGGHNRKMYSSRIIDADATVKKTINGPGTYAFDTAALQTAFSLDFSPLSALSGITSIMTNFLLNSVGNTSWCTGTNTPMAISDYRWVVKPLEQFTFDTATLGINLSILQSLLGGLTGMLDPSHFSIYQRPLDGEGEFCQLPTTYANNTLSATITSLSEFFIGSETDTFNFNPTSVEDYNNIMVNQFATISPNPAANEAKINFEVKENSNAALIIHDITGRIVKTIDTKKVSPGFNSISLNLADVSNGMYFCKLIVNGKSFATLKLSVRH